MKTKHDDKLNKRLDRWIGSGAKAHHFRTVGSWVELRNGSYCGLQQVDGSDGIPAIYDSIQYDPSISIGVVEIDKELAIIDIQNGQLLTDFRYDKVEFTSGNQSAVLHKNNLKGLFDIALRKEIFAPIYNDISIRAGLRYAWTYSSTEGYCYIDTFSGKCIALGDMPDECFDETHGHIFILKAGKVQLITDDGVSDPYAYRELLASLGGRITLYNSTHGVSIIADIYGCVL